MRIGYISCFSIWHNEVDIADTLEEFGHEVDRYHHTCIDMDRFLSRAKRYDVVITAVPHTLPKQFFLDIKSRGPKLIAWYFDWIWDYLGRHKHYIQRIKDFDLTLSSDGDTDKRYRDAGVKRRYMRMACNTRIYRPVHLTNEERKEYSHDVGFVGHSYFPRRKALIDGLASSFDFCHWGQFNEAYGINHAKIVAATKIMVADNFRNDVPNYWSNRVYTEVGSGGFLLHPRVPKMDKVYKDKEHLVYWDDMEDLHGKIRYYLRHDDEREEIARCGQKLIHKYHNWNTRIREFEDICESELSLTPTSRLASGCSDGISSSTCQQTLSSP